MLRLAIVVVKEHARLRARGVIYVLVSAQALVLDVVELVRVRVVHVQLHVDRDVVNLVHRVQLHVDRDVVNLVHHVDLHVDRDVGMLVRPVVPIHVRGDVQDALAHVDRGVLLNRLQLVLRLMELKQVH